MPRLRVWKLWIPADYWAWLDWRRRVFIHQQLGWLYMQAHLPPAVYYQNAIDQHWKQRRHRKDKRLMNPHRPDLGPFEYYGTGNHAAYLVYGWLLSKGD